MTKKSLRALLNEAEIQMQLNHVNILKLMEIYIEKSHIYFVTELLDMDAFSYLAQYQQNLSEQQIADLTVKILKALEHCNRYSVIHRDIKLENILVWVDQQGNINDLKIADFGMAKRTKGTSSNTHKRRNSLFGTVGYMAPEVILKDQNYDQRIDTYSLGVVLYNIVTREELFTGNQE